MYVRSKIKTETERKEAIELIEAQLKNGYIDLSFHDEHELEIVKEAINILKIIDEWCGVLEKYAAPAEKE